MRGTKTTTRRTPPAEGHSRKGETMANTITIDGITLTHRLFYDSGHPTGGTAGHKDGRDYVIGRDLGTNGYPWALCVIEQGQRVIRHLTPEEVAEYEALLQEGRGRSRQIDEESSADDLTAEVEEGRMTGGGPADI